MADKRRLTPDPLTYERQGDSTVLRPSAQPVETFVRPAAPAPSELHGLSEALAQVNPKLNAFAVRQIDADRREDIKKAERGALASTAVTLQEAIDKGEIQPGQSPLFQRVFEETTAKREAITTAPMTLYQAWVSPENPDRNSTDPKVINGFFDRETKKMLEGKSENYKEGFVPHLLAARQQLSNKITAENAAEIEEKLQGELGQLMFDRLKGAKGQSPAQLAAIIAEDTIPARFAGLKGSKANGIIAQAIVAAAQTSGNTDLLKVGYEPRPDLKNPGQMIPGVFTQPKYAVLADNAQTSILSKQNALAARSAAAEARSDRAAVKSFFPLLLKYRQENPDDPNVPPELLTKAAELSIPPTAVQANWAASGKIATPMRYGDKISKLAELARISNENGDVAGFLARTPGLVTDEKAYSILAEGGLKQTFSNDMYQVQSRSIDGMLDTFMKKFDPQQGANIVREAKSELSGRVTDLYLNLSKEGNGHVDPKKLSDGIRDLGAEITTRMREAGEAKETPTPKATPSAAPAKPEGKKAEAGAPAAAAAPKLAAVIPTDHIVPLSTLAQVGGLPEAPNGSAWTPVTQDGLDMKTINYLRTDPMKDVQGRPLWQHIDERYGPGASRWLMTSTVGEINFMLKKSKFNNTPGQPLTTTLDEIGDALTRPRSQPTK